MRGRRNNRQPNSNNANNATGRQSGSRRQRVADDVDEQQQQFSHQEEQRPQQQRSQSRNQQQQQQRQQQRRTDADASKKSSRSEQPKQQQLLLERPRLHNPVFDAVLVKAKRILSSRRITARQEKIALALQEESKQQQQQEKQQQQQDKTMLGFFGGGKSADESNSSPAPKKTITLGKITVTVEFLQQLKLMHATAYSQHSNGIRVVGGSLKNLTLSWVGGMEGGNIGGVMAQEFFDVSASQHQPQPQHLAASSSSADKRYGAEQIAICVLVRQSGLVDDEGHSLRPSSPTQKRQQSDVVTSSGGKKKGKNKQQQQQQQCDDAPSPAAPLPQQKSDFTVAGVLTMRSPVLDLEFEEPAPVGTEICLFYSSVAMRNKRSGPAGGSRGAAAPFGRLAQDPTSAASALDGSGAASAGARPGRFHLPSAAANASAASANNNNIAAGSNRPMVSFVTEMNLESEENHALGLQFKQLSVIPEDDAEWRVPREWDKQQCRRQHKKELIQAAASEFSFRQNRKGGDGNNCSSAAATAVERELLGDEMAFGGARLQQQKKEGQFSDVDDDDEDDVNDDDGDLDTLRMKKTNADDDDEIPNLELANLPGTDERS